MREIRSGSIIVELLALGGYAMTTIGGVNTVVTLAKNLKGMVEYGRGLVSSPPEGTTKRDAEDFVRFIQPVATDNRATLNIQVSDKARVNVLQQVFMTSETANASQNRVQNWVAQQSMPTTGRHEGVLFYWFQARTTGTSGVGDKGIIETLFPRALRTSFASDEVKATMLRDRLFKMAYIVDVDVQTVGEQPLAYRILRVVDSFSREE